MRPSLGACGLLQRQQAIQSNCPLSSCIDSRWKTESRSIDRSQRDRRRGAIGVPSQPGQERQRGRRFGRADRRRIGKQRCGEELDTAPHIVERRLRIGRAETRPECASRRRGDVCRVDDDLFRLRHVVSSLSEHCPQQIVDGRKDVGVIGQRAAERRPTGRHRADPSSDQPRRGNEHARAGHLRKPAIAESADADRQFNELSRCRLVHASFVYHDLAFDIRRREVEADGDEALSRARLELLERVLVAGVVGDDELESWRRLDDLSVLLDRQQTAVIAERVNDDDHVLPRFDHLVQITDRSMSRGEGERAVLPNRVAAPNEPASGEVSCREVVMTGQGDERPR